MRTIKVSCDINCSPELIIKAFTDHTMLSGWWGVERSSITLEKGGGYYLVWEITDQGMKYINSAVIQEYDPMSKLLLGNFAYFAPDRPVMDGMYMHIYATLIDTETSRLEIEQGPFPINQSEHWDWIYNAVEDGWDQVFVILKKYLESY